MYVNMQDVYDFFSNCEKFRGKESDLGRLTERANALPSKQFRMVNIIHSNKRLVITFNLQYHAAHQTKPQA